MTDRLTALLPAALLALSLLAAPAAAQDTPAASFAQLEGRDACVRALGVFEFDADPLKGCTTASALGGPVGMVLSPDQTQMLVAARGFSDGSSAIVTLNRSTETGALDYVSCLSNDGGDGRLGSDGLCSDGDGLSGLTAITMTPDGEAVFATSRSSSSLVWFDRDPATGALTQRGCLKNFAWQGERCTSAPLLAGASGVAVTPDGTLVFVSAAATASLAVFRRDVETGDLTRIACASDSGSDGLCTDVAGLGGADNVVITPDGTGVFVTSPTLGAITAFDLDPETGELTQRACLAEIVAEKGKCTAVETLAGLASAALSSDGTSLYVGATGDEALTAFRREDDGSLTNDGCFVFQSPQPGDDVEEDFVDEDDEDFEDDETVHEDAEDARTAQNDDEDFEEEDNGTGGCTKVRALFPSELAISSDGRALFSLGSDFLSVFRRDPNTGKLTWLACAEEDLSYKTCVQAHGIDGVTAMTTTPDGRNLYVASNSWNAVSVFAASVAVAARANVRASGRARVSLRCPAARPLPCFGRVRHALIRGKGARFRLAPGAHKAVTIRLRAHVAARVKHRRIRALTVTATDATGLTRPARKRLRLRARW